MVMELCEYILVRELGRGSMSREGEGGMVVRIEREEGVKCDERKAGRGGVMGWEGGITRW